MESKIILSFSPGNGAKVFLMGRGKERERLLHAYGKYVERELPRVKNSLMRAMRGNHAFTSVAIH